MAKGAVTTPVIDGRLKALETQANDLGEARKALDSATSIARGLWFTFLSLTAYLVISVGSVSHKDLFLETPVKLPLLNVDLPLVTFFWVSPLMFLVIHAYLLLNLKFMSDNARHYFEEVDRTGLDDASKHRLYLQLSNFLILQMLIVRRQKIWGVMGIATHFVVVLTVMIAPILVLLLIQLQFLPYHSIEVTTIHRLAVAADMGLLLFFWQKIAGVPETRRIAAMRHSIWVVVFAVVLFSGFVATFPGEIGRQTSVAKSASLAEYLFHSPVHQVKGQRQRWFSDTLVLTDADFVSLDDEKVPQEVTVSLRGRNLQGAFLARTDLRKADFTGAELDGANFRDAKLRGAFFGCPLVRVEHGQKSLSKCTSLNNAILDGADLRSAYMRQASLKNASLQGVKLEGANLEGAYMQGALLKDSTLAKANFRKADLSGAKIENSDLGETKLTESILAGTLIYKSTLRGSDMTSARLKAPALLEVNVLDVQAEKTDWSSVLAQNPSEDETAFVVNLPAEGLNTIVSASALSNADSSFTVASADRRAGPSFPAMEAITRSAIMSKGKGTTETDQNRWNVRLEQLHELMCKDVNPNAVEIFARLSTMPGSEKDEVLAFGPQRRAFIDRLLLPSCKNVVALKDPVCRMLTVWKDKGGSVPQMCDKNQ